MCHERTGDVQVICVVDMSLVRYNALRKVSS